jgi:hypothetical protein
VQLYSVESADINLDTISVHRVHSEFNIVKDTVIVLISSVY